MVLFSFRMMMFIMMMMSMLMLIIFLIVSFVFLLKLDLSKPHITVFLYFVQRLKHVVPDIFIIFDAATESD